MRVPKTLSGVPKVIIVLGHYLPLQMTFALMLQKQWWVDTLVQIKVVDPNSMKNRWIIYYYVPKVKTKNLMISKKES